MGRRDRQSDRETETFLEVGYNDFKISGDRYCTPISCWYPPYAAASPDLIKENHKESGMKKKDPPAASREIAMSDKRKKSKPKISESDITSCGLSKSFLLKEAKRGDALLAKFYKYIYPDDPDFVAFNIAINKGDRLAATECQDSLIETAIVRKIDRSKQSSERAKRPREGPLHKLLDELIEVYPDHTPLKYLEEMKKPDYSALIIAVTSNYIYYRDECQRGVSYLICGKNDSPNFEMLVSRRRKKLGKQKKKTHARKKR